MKTHRNSRSFARFSALAFLALGLFVQAATAQNLVVNGDFESGNTGFTTRYAFGDVSGPGTYNIGTNPSSAPDAYSDWCNCGDHTSGAGMMMIVNGANSVAWPVWEEVVQVTPSTNYTFSYWGAEVDHDSNSLPHIAVKINGRTIGNSYFPGNSPDNGGQWVNFSFTWNSGASHTADLVLVDLNTDTVFNDFALDDISFTPVPAPAASPSAGLNGAAPGPATRARTPMKNSETLATSLSPARNAEFIFMSTTATPKDGRESQADLRRALAGITRARKFCACSAEG